MKLKTLDFLLVGTQGVLFLVYLVPIKLSAGLILSGVYLWPALLALFVGILEIVWALWQLGRFLSPFPKPKNDAPLITIGIFGWVRHPIYSGIILAAAGYGFYAQDLFKVLIATIFLLFFYLKSRYEEQNMILQFPEYEAYKNRVGRFFPKLFAA